jgi:hypothetical protein
LYKPPSFLSSSSSSSTSSISISDELPSEEERDATPVANYLERLVMPLSGSVVKKSFSPFGNGGKDLEGQGSGSDILYKPPSLSLSSSSSISDELLFEEERDATPVANYLERLVMPLSGSVVKKSFSPFGNGGKDLEGQGSGSDILYKPPSLSSSSSSSSSISDELPSEEERDATPVANYLERLVMPLSGSVVKKSFSPFGNGGKDLEGQGSGSDILYKPPSLSLSSSSSISDELLFEEERDATPVANYLERLVMPLSGSVVKKSFSPFGNGGKDLEGQGSGSDILYKPPSLSSSSSSISDELLFEEERDATPVANYLERLVMPLSGSVVKKSFSPFGNGGKDLEGQGSGSDILYKPPSFLSSSSSSSTSSISISDELPSEGERETNPVADSLESPSAPMTMVHTITSTSVDGTHSSQASPEISDINLVEVMDNESSEEIHLSRTDDSSVLNSRTADEEENRFDTISPEPTSPPESLDCSPPTKSLKMSNEGRRDTDKPSISNLITSENERISLAYEEWCNTFEKEPSVFRFEIFSTRYKTVKKYHEENGTPLMLNEFSDLTEEEYKVTTKEVVDDGKIDHVIEERIISAYKQWCDWYSKDFSHDRLQVFASNFLILEQYNGGESSKSPMCFNEYSDLTEEEYRSL